MINVHFSPVGTDHFLPTPQDCGKARSASPVNWTNPSQQEHTGQNAAHEELALHVMLTMHNHLFSVASVCWCKKTKNSHYFYIYIIIIIFKHFKRNISVSKTLGIGGCGKLPQFSVCCQILNVGLIHLQEDVFWLDVRVNDLAFSV